jgi:hypothetical protein
MLKKIMFLLIVASSLALAVPAAQKSRAVGGWLQLGNAGEHFGLDYKYRRTETTAIDIYGHFYFSSGDNALGVYFAHYWHNYNLLKLASDFGRIGLYAGPAGGFGWWFVDHYKGAVFTHDESGLALRFGVVGGITWEMPIPLEIYAELNPVGEFHVIFDDYRDNRYDDNYVTWQIPDLYFRMGIRFWF